MPKFSANLSFQFTERPFPERFAAAAAAGYRAVEYLFPYDHPAAEVRGWLGAAGLSQALFNAPPGDWAGGERGLACLEGRGGEFDEAVARAIDYATALGCPRVHVMAGIAEVTPASRGRYVEAIGRACARFAAAGLDLLIEPINRRDMPGYFLGDFALAETVIREIGAPNLKLQYDVYHRQIIHGDVTRSLEAMMPLIGHVQIASIPERQEPDGGELDYAHVFATLDRLGYGGWVGCEYRPRGRTEDGLGWMTKLVRG